MLIAADTSDDWRRLVRMLLVLRSNQRRIYIGLAMVVVCLALVLLDAKGQGPDSRG